MDAARLAVDLLTGLAWPVVVVAIAIVFRREVRSVLQRGNPKVKVGPFEFGIEQVRVDVEATAQPLSSPTRAAGSTDAELLTTELATLADQAPTAAVLQAHEILTAALRQTVRETVGGDDTLERASAAQLATKARNAGLITEQQREAVLGVTVLRNLAAHGQAADLDAAKASDYLALVDSTLYWLRQPRSTDS